ncbi:MAG: M20/M25/M40 family metallo-hydrolase [Armatimonas sp.]
MDNLEETCKRLLEAAKTTDVAYKRLGWLCDRIGARLSGSKSLDTAIAWAASELKADGFDAVRTEPVMVPRWERGKESGELLTPMRRPLRMLGLGGTVSGKIQASVLVVKDFDELRARGSEAKGKVVCYDVPFTSYGQTVRYRATGPSEAAKLGAVGVLVRSVGPAGFQTPHTGALRYADDAPKIPAAAISIEDATLLARMQARGENPTVRLSLGGRMLKDARSANVIAELKGREKPDEIVVIGGHLDSWDVGQGAHDDGGGCLTCWEALRLMKTLDIRPRRTIRLVLFTNEENGTAGGKAYAQAHASEKHILAIEVDGGVGAPQGFGLTVKSTSGFAQAKAWERLGTGPISEGGGGTDIGPLGEKGVPTAGLKNDMSLYWNIHHTHADTFDKIDKGDLNACVGALAVFAYAAAETDALG